MHKYDVRAARKIRKLDLSYSVSQKAKEVTFKILNVIHPSKNYFF